MLNRNFVRICNLNGINDTHLFWEFNYKNGLISAGQGLLSFLVVCVLGRFLGGLDNWLTRYGGMVFDLARHKLSNRVTSIRKT